MNSRLFIGVVILANIFLSNLSLECMDSAAKPAFSAVAKAGVTYLAKSAHLTPKLTRLLVAAAATGGVFYTFKETSAAQKFYSKLNTLSHKYPGTFKVVSYVAQGGAVVIGLLVANPTMATSLSLLGASSTLAKGLETTALENARQGIASAVGRSFESDSHLISSELQSNFNFSNIAGGLAGVPSEIQDIVDQLKNPSNYPDIPMPKGVLLWGQPGTGKTLLAKAIAGELSDCAFYSANAAHFISQFIGTGPKNVKALFDEARGAINAGKVKQAVLFIDELDGIGKRSEIPEGDRGTKIEENKTVNALLSELDGVLPSDGIFVIGATNLPDLIDEAVKRQGRLDNIIEIPLPNARVREDLWRMYLQPINDRLKQPLEIERLVDLSEGYTPAAISGTISNVNRSAVRKKEEITTELFEKSLRRSYLQGLKEKRHVSLRTQSIENLVEQTNGCNKQEIDDEVRRYLNNRQNRSPVAAAQMPAYGESGSSSSSSSSMPLGIDG